MNLQIYLVFLFGIKLYTILPIDLHIDFNGYKTKSHGLLTFPIYAAV